MAMVAGSRWSGWASTKAVSTSPSTESDCFRSRGSVIASRSSNLITRSRYWGSACIFRPQMR